MSLAYSYSLYEREDQRTEVKEVKGVLSFMDEELLFEFKVYDVHGTALSTLNKFSIDIGQIKRMRFMKGFFSSKLIIEAKQIAFFEPLPGSEQGTIKLKIDRANKDEAVDFSTKLNLYLSQKKLDEMEED